VIADDRQSSYALVDYIHKQKGYDRVAVLRANNRYGRVGVMEFRDAATRIGHPLVMEIRFEDGETDFREQLEKIRNTNPDVVLLWGNALEMGLIINQMREMGMEYPVFTSDRAVNPVFIETAGKNADGVVTTCQYNPKADNPELKAFQKHYRERFGMEPDVFAAHAYDGMNIAIKAIEKTGLNKARIRDLLTDLDTFQGYEGITGPIILDASWNDIGPIWMAEIRDGDFHFSPATWNYE
jgi:ABC-type branched-subunit amino acid transport system substrate-binding protein